MARLPYPDLDAVSAEKQQAVGWPGRKPLNVTHMALHAPDKLWRAHYAQKMAMVYATSLDPWLREVLILRVAHLAKSDYELNHHISISANLGFTPAQQDALRTQDYADLTPEERAVAQFTDEVVTQLRPSDETLATARELFGDPLIIEMTILIGSYWGTAMMVGVTGVEPDHAPVKSWAD